MTDNKVKLDNSKSRFGKKSEAEKKSKEEFNTEVSEFQQKNDVINNKVANLTTNFVSMVRDTELNSNKGPIKIEMEKSVPKDLADLFLELDNDPNHPEGYGSIGGVLLLLKCTMLQRDIINELSYKISLLEKKLSSPIKVDDK